ncbi:MAG: tetracycline resistance MFS efflux pump [Anaerolineae bacterium]
MRSSRVNLIILFFTLVVVMMGFGMVIPIMPFYVDSFGAGGSALGLLMAEYALAQFIFAPIWGELSDRFGRRPVLLLGVLGNALAQLLFGLSTQLWMLFVARGLAGVLSSATLPTAMAYIGDSTSEEERGGGMGMIGGAMGIGMVIGPGLGGWLAGESLSLPFFIAAALSALALVLIYLILPESLPAAERSSQRGVVRGPQLGELWRALFSPIGILLVMAFVISFGLTNFESIFGMYALEKFGYGPQQVGTILMGIGITSAVVQMALTGPLTRRFGDVQVIRATLLISALGFVLLTFARSYAGVMATSMFFVLGNAMVRPAVSSLTSKRAAGGQGVAMGLNNAFMSLGRIVGPIWAGVAIDTYIELPYLSGAVVMLIAMLIAIIWLKQTHTPAEGASEAAGSGAYYPLSR